MSPPVNVRSIDALIELKLSLARYAQELAAPMAALDLEAMRTLEILSERRRHWQRQVQIARQAVSSAQAALSRCEATVYRDPKTGAVHRPDCSVHRAAVAQAVRHLRAVEAELHKVEQALNAVEQARTDFRRHQQRMRLFIERELVEAQNFLDQRATNLRNYAATGLPSNYSVTAPTQALANIAALGTVALTIGITSVALAAIKTLAGHLPILLGDSGEAMAEQFLRKEFNWQAIPFDQPKHGFDRVFTAPGLPLIVVECKVNRKGELHLGNPLDGEQGSPEWIAAQASHMSNPASKQYSPANAAIAELVTDLGPENIPVIAVVITTETGKIDLHYRRPGSMRWKQFDEGMNLTEILRMPPENDLQS